MLHRMTRLLIFTVLLVALSVSSAFSALTWWEVGVPYRVKIFTMAVNKNELYAGTWGEGVYKLSARDSMWHELNLGMTNKEIRAMIVKDDEVYVGTWGAGIFKMNSLEKYWTNVSSGLTNNNILSMIKLDKDIYAGTWGGGVFKLFDGASEWVKVSDGLTNRNINALVNSEGDVYAGTDEGVFVLKKGEVEWESINLKQIINCLIIGIDGELFAGTQKGVYILKKGATIWEAKTRGLRDRFILDMVISKRGSIYIGTNSGVFRLVKGGRSFKSINKGLTNTNIQSLHISYMKVTRKMSKETIFAGTSVGVYKSLVLDNPNDNKIEEWKQIKTGLTKTTVRALTINGRNIFAGTNKGVFMMREGRGNWRDINRGLGNMEIETLATNSGDIYAGTWGAGLYVLRENSNEWTEIPSPKKYIWSLYSIGTRVYVGTWGAIYAFNVTDMSWVPFNKNLNNSNLNVYAITGAGGDLYIGTDKGLYKLGKESDEWEHFTDGFTHKDLSIYDLATDDMDVYVATAHGVYLLREGKTKFELIDKGFSNPNVYALVSAGKNIYAGTWREVLRYDAKRNRWVKVADGLSKNTSVMELLESGGDLYAGTYGEGVFAGSLPPIITTNGGDDFSTGDKSITITGTCYPYITSVKVNGSTDSVIFSPGSTTWSYKTTLEPSVNRFLITNVNELGNESGYSEIIINYTGSD